MVMHMKILPSTNVSRCNNCFARTTEYASQIEALIATSLHVIRELNNNNVCHGVTVLFQNRKKTTHTQKSVTSSIKSNSFGALIHLNFVFVIHEKKERIRTLKKSNENKTNTNAEKEIYLLFVCHIQDNLVCR